MAGAAKGAGTHGAQAAAPRGWGEARHAVMASPGLAGTPETRTAGPTALLVQAAGVVVGRQVADQGGDAAAVLEKRQRLLQERGLAGAGAGDEADDVNAGVLEAHAQAVGDEVVLLQDAPADLDDARLRAHDSI